MPETPPVVDNAAASRFEILVEGAVAGFAVYRREEGGLAFTHTEVDPAFEGRGLGSALARSALDAARESGAAVLNYLLGELERSGYIERHPAYVDLVPADQRERFGLPTHGDIAGGT